MDKTIDKDDPVGTVLPRPAPAFKGKIGRTYAESVQGPVPQTCPPTGAPNVLIVLLDDVGFAQTGTFGGSIPTPALDELARGGLRYNCFHTTAMCTPTRAAMLTGRNPHNVGCGSVVEFATGFPGYNGVWPRSAACVAEILRQGGYATAAIGKWHNTPMWEIGPTGPFDRWPTGMGFEYFFGFMGGATSQWEPTLYENVTPVVNPGRPVDYHLSTELADRAIGWIDGVHSFAPEKPFFMWLAPGATHAPHHVSEEWIRKFKGQFDDGWDVYRERAFARQKQLGVIPEDAELTPRPEEIGSWASLSPDEKRLATKMMEVFAAFTAHTDFEVGRVFDHLRSTGQFDNTLILYAVGDNGASAEGGARGTVDAMSRLNGLEEPLTQMLARIDELGTPAHHNHFPTGWAWAMNTPFQWAKRTASHLGGVRNPLVVSWPRGIPSGGEVRKQFHHVVDIVPTVLEAAGIPIPASVNGTQQQPVDGTSMCYSFPSNGPTVRQSQIFEIMANRGIYHEGWWACARENVPWLLTNGQEKPLDLARSKWELYYLESDFSQCRDLAQSHPEKLRELQEMFWERAAAGNILPLDSRNNRMTDAMALSGALKPANYRFRSRTVGIYEGAAPDLRNRSFKISARLVANEADEGVLLAMGGRIGGYSLFIRKHRCHFWYNFLGMEQTCISSERSVPTGATTITVEFTYDGGGKGKGGSIAFGFDGNSAGGGRLERTVANMFARESFDIGMDLNSPVGDYAAPFPYSGHIEEIVIELGAN